jgi:hypothetical protein
MKPTVISPSTRARTPRGAGVQRGRRGRPPKFGRASHVLALTLPDDVLATLRGINADPGWAIVQLVEQLVGNGHRRSAPRPSSEIAELVHLPGARALIVVEPRAFAGIPGIATIPLADGRAFLAFDHAIGLADLEVALLDRAEAAAPASPQRARLLKLRDIVRTWRRDRRLAFRPMSILVVSGTHTAMPRLLPAIKGGRHRTAR